MFRHSARISSLLVGVAAGGLLLATPAEADITPIGLPPMLCPITWTNVIIGTEHDDDILGTPANDLIVAGGGDDEVYGGGGRDIILGGDGDDVLAGGPADDCVLGGAGDDESVQWTYSVPNGTTTATRSSTATSTDRRRPSTSARSSSGCTVRRARRSGENPSSETGRIGRMDLSPMGVRASAGTLRASAGVFTTPGQVTGSSPHRLATAPRCCTSPWRCAC